MNSKPTEPLDFRETASYKEAIGALHNRNADTASRERLPYKDDTLPFGVWTDIYHYLIDHAVNCHWHHDFEYGVLLEGSVDLYIGNTYIRLEKGDAFFVNSNILHMSRQTEDSGDAVMYTLTFSASLLSSNTCSTLYTKYLQPMLNTQIEGFRISSDSPVGLEIQTLLLRIYELEPSAFGYELECMEHIHRLWLTTLRFMKYNKSVLLYHTGDIRHSERMKEILFYIHRHYGEKMTAAGIAEHVSISRGECFRCFKHFMNKTPVEYINEYRLQQAAVLLRETDRNITDISTSCGFENASYFSRLFRSAFGMTPFQYRKAQIWTDGTIRNINGYDYEYWKDSGNGTMIITANANSGSFSCDWHSINNITFRSGKKFRVFDKTHRQLGNISLQYEVACRSDGNTYLCVYGWTVEPLIEWYIVECYTAYKPSIHLPGIGTLKLDDGTYELYHTSRENRPSILGTQSFGQYWSIRTSGRFGGTVDVSAHLSAWENAGLALGCLTEISFAIEGWKSSGNATVKTNVITIAR